MKSYLIGVATACFVTISLNANAVVLNTLNGVNYQWLELTTTSGMSRNQVEAQIASATAGDALYGYEYASRGLVEDLLLSYTSWDGLDGHHGNGNTVSGINALIADFGITFSNNLNGDNFSITAVDGYSVQYASDGTGYITDAIASSGLYGTTDECGGAQYSCAFVTLVAYDESGIPTLAYQNSGRGWDSTNGHPLTRNVSFESADYGSFLVQTSVVPVPAAVWLFGSGLLGLIGVARRQKVA